jgi:2-phosphoglycolate phosphatase
MTNKHPLEAVLFDLDGTLIDTAPDFANAVNKLRQRHQRSDIAYPLIRQTVSHGARALVTLAFDLKEDDDGFDELRIELLDLYSQHLCVDTCLFPGMAELLDWLDQQQIPWGIVTNKPRQYAEPIIAALGLNQRCQSLVCPDDVRNTKPDPEPMFLACQQLNCAADNTLYLGDHRRDIDAGKNANMKTLATNYGYIEPDDPSSGWNADFYVNHGDEIKAVINANFFLAFKTYRKPHAQL